MVSPNIAGWTMKEVTGLRGANDWNCSAVKSGAFGGVALFAVIFFASGIPRVQKDILQKIPVIGGHFIKEIPASDNIMINRIDEQRCMYREPVLKQYQ
ncbi:hypothetical protein RRF57_009197 [Xylaria bambusicola]|uniref:Uncharacterized protein n=1 Tax=Xylaria bambusicola TaxID=326684 RepID=A0AAN7UUK2_9PEZI